MRNKDSAAMNPGIITSVLVLAGCFTLVHLFYEGIVRPTAAAILAAEGSSGLFSVWVIIKDMEQQVCFSLLLFCLFLMGYKLWRLLDEETLYTRDFLRDYDKSLPLDVELALSELEASSYKDNPAMATWINCIRRFKNTRNVQHAADAIESSVESLAAQLESGNSMVRYIIWAIPSIGFVGTVRGIGQALAQADKALAGDIAGMTASLGVAFNSTLVALFISLILMYFMHILNGRQDTMVLNTQQSCEKHLLAHLHN
ncbi:biopolymer transport protein ExbB/TolQ [Rheinheimera pacifica]|jgi:biopolymer transport protein ExbB/TolQ|uniref:MotA/TolQ/ExbB proton channel family protein n=1 Tax=Rheinheimera pacifica TaxID=173990 RepID=UPI002166F9BE|nr:MotA/TolQ/ExbB proton channel family protein [Rheinheimera pacifica]MCS4308943.1 biopolymer transport protein ExbB/TolQ [Rheinheimera pacifica]